MLKEYSTSNYPEAPRFTVGNCSIITRDFIKRLKNQYPELKGIHERDIKALVRKFHEEEVYSYLLNNRHPLELPNNLGTIVVGVYGKEPVIDRAFSLELGKKVHHRSAHSDGHGATFYYTCAEKYNKFSPGKNMWAFDSTRKGKHGLRDKMKDGTSWRTYMYMRNRKYINEALQLAKYKLSHLTYKKDKFKDYNELEISED